MRILRGGGRGGVKYYALNVDLSKVGGLNSGRIRRWERTWIGTKVLKGFKK